MIEMFLSRHKSIHRFFFKFFYDELSSEQLRCRPHPQVNSIAWVLWHSARSEDCGINRLATDGVQVADAGGWLERMRIPFRHFGIGMAQDEVDVLSRAIDLDALRAYHEAVGKRTADVVSGLSMTHLQEVMEGTDIIRILSSDEMVKPGAGDVLNSYAGMTRGWLIMHLGLTHPYTHIGEATTIASLMGIHHF